MDPQIIIKNVRLPETSHDRYSCGETPLSVQVDMISGRRVIEERDLVYKVTYSHDYIEDSVLRPALAALRGGKLIAAVLTDMGETVTASFVVESLTDPKILTFEGAEPIWHGLAFTLREEFPHKSSVYS